MKKSEIDSKIVELQAEIEKLKAMEPTHVPKFKKGDKVMIPYVYTVSDPDAGGGDVIVEYNNEKIYFEEADLELVHTNTSAPYKKGEFYWSKDKERVFRVTDTKASKGDWHAKHVDDSTPFRLYSPASSVLVNYYHKAEIIDTPVYEFDGKRWIWDGGEERVPAIDDHFVCESNHAVHKHYIGGPLLKHINDGRRKILIPLVEVE